MITRSFLYLFFALAWANTAFAEQVHIGSDLTELFKNYCYKCHSNSSEKLKGDLNLEISHSADELNFIYELIYEQLTAGEMPPEKSKQPTAEEKARMFKLVEAESRKHKAGSPVRYITKDQLTQLVEDVFGVTSTPDFNFSSENDLGMEVSDHSMMNQAQLNNYFFSVEQIVDKLLPVTDLSAKEYTFTANEISLIRGTFPYKEGFFVVNHIIDRGRRTPQLVFYTPIDGEYEFSFDLAHQFEDAPFTQKMDGISITSLDPSSISRSSGKLVASHQGKLLDLPQFTSTISLKTGMTVGITLTCSDESLEENDYFKRIYDLSTLPGFYIHNIKLRGPLRVGLHLLFEDIITRNKSLDTLCDTLLFDGKRYYATYNGIYKDYLSDRSYEGKRQKIYALNKTLKHLFNSPEFMISDLYTKEFHPTRLSLAFYKHFRKLEVAGESAQDIRALFEKENLFFENLVDFWLKYDQYADLSEISRERSVANEIPTVERLKEIYINNLPLEAIILPDQFGASSKNGLLRDIPFLTLSNNGPGETSPVVRGIYVLSKLFGGAPPPPPDDVTPLEDIEVPEGTSLRDKLDLHKSNESCANCHIKFDPLGYPLEVFDGAGNFREHYQNVGYGVQAQDTEEGITEKHLEKVETATVYQGQPVKDLDDLETHITSTFKPKFYYTFARYFASFCLGRSLSPTESTFLKQLLEDVSKDGTVHLQDFTIAFLTSELFINGEL